MNHRTRILAVTAGILFAATAAIDIPHDQAEPFVSTADYVLEALFALSLAFGAATSWLLARASTGRVTRIGWGLAALGHATVAFVAGATHVNGHDVLGSVFPLGLLGMLLGYIVLLVQDLRRRVTPRFAGLVLAGSFVAMIVLGDGYGVVASSAGWFALAALLGGSVRTRVPEAQLAEPNAGGSYPAHGVRASAG